MMDLAVVGIMVFGIYTVILCELAYENGKLKETVKQKDEQIKRIERNIRMCG